MDKTLTVIPCTPFEGSVYDIRNDKTVRAKITGYRIAIRELTAPPHCGFTPIALASGAKHGIIAVPEWKLLEPVSIFANGNDHEDDCA